MLGSLGVPEIIFIVVLALLIFGPKRLPELGRTVGKGLAEFRRASTEIQRTINAELALEEDPKPAQYPRRVALTESETGPVEPRTPPAGALARGGRGGGMGTEVSSEAQHEPDGPPVDLVDMAYVTPDPDETPEGVSAAGTGEPSVAPVEPSQGR